MTRRATFSGRSSVEILAQRWASLKSLDLVPVNHEVPRCRKPTDPRTARAAEVAVRDRAITAAARRRRDRAAPRNFPY